MQCSDVLPCLGIPHFHQSILTAAGQNCLTWVPVTALDVATMARHVTLGSAAGKVPHLRCRYSDNGTAVTYFNFNFWPCTSAAAVCCLQAHQTILTPYRQPQTHGFDVLGTNRGPTDRMHNTHKQKMFKASDHRASKT